MNDIPCSPDLKLVDFWLWDRHSPSSLVKMKATIRHKYSCIKSEKLHIALNVAITHLQTAIFGGGGQIEHVQIPQR